MKLKVERGSSFFLPNFNLSFCAIIEECVLVWRVGQLIVVVLLGKVRWRIAVDWIWSSYRGRL